MDKISTIYGTMIIPDVHGRTFWKEPVIDALESTQAKIVFLGDYLDPYWDEFDENIEDVRKKAMEQLKEIIGLKIEHPKRISLLLGNHDLTYALSTAVCECRTDYKNFEEIRKIFTENRNLFQLADEATVNGRHFIFTHAGINQKYARLCFGNDASEDNVVKKFNHAWETNNLDILMTLGQYSRWRGHLGESYGSLVWADAREWDGKNNVGFGFGVVGHTQLEKPYINEELHMAFLDCRKVFIINDEGGIIEYQKESHEQKA